MEMVDKLMNEYGLKVKRKGEKRFFSIIISDEESSLESVAIELFRDEMENIEKLIISDPKKFIESFGLKNKMPLHLQELLEGHSIVYNAAYNLFNIRTIDGDYLTQNWGWEEFWTEEWSRDLEKVEEAFELVSPGYKIEKVFYAEKALQKVLNVLYEESTNVSDIIQNIKLDALQKELMYLATQEMSDAINNLKKRTLGNVQL